MKTIMLIDNSKKEWKLFEEAVKSIDARHQCIVAEDGYSGINYLTNSQGPPPDFIFLEAHLPRMSGIECIHLIKKHKVLAHIPIILFTTSHILTDEEAGNLDGVAQCFQKAETLADTRFMIASVIQAGRKNGIKPD